MIFRLLSEAHFFSLQNFSFHRLSRKFRLQFAWPTAATTAVTTFIIIIINTPRKNEMKNKKLKRLENDMKVKLKTVKKGLI
jgi:cytochrome bd-type quinol oxidase subunit 1